MQKKPSFQTSDQVLELIREKKASIRLRKNRWKLCGKLRRSHGLVLAAFHTQILLPAAAVAVYAFILREPYLLFAAVVYVLLPFFLPLGCIAATVLTGVGLAGLLLSWPPPLVALCLPAELYFLGGEIWWMSIQWAILSDAMGDRLFFKELWEAGLLFVQTEDGFWGYSDTV